MKKSLAPGVSSCYYVMGWEALCFLRMAKFPKKVYFEPIRNRMKMQKRREHTQ